MKNKFRVLALFLACLMLLNTLCLLAGCKDKQTDYYTVTFDADGGTSVASKTVPKNTKIGTLPVTSKEGYRFFGWTDVKGNPVNIDEQYVVTKDITLFAVFNKGQEEHGGQEETCTVTYSTSGTLVNVSTVRKGQPIGSLPFTDKQGYSFLGWFFDKELKNRVYTEDIITEDITLYAGFEKQDVDSVLPEYTELSIGCSDINYEIRFRSNEFIDERNLGSFISITALYGEVPQIAVNAIAADEYALSPVGGFRNGGVYKITINDDRVSFVDLDAAHGDDYTDEKAIRTLYLSVEADINEELVLVKSGIFEMKRSSVTFSSSENKFTATKEVFEKLPFSSGSVVNIIDDDECRYIKIIGINEVNGEYEFTFSDCSSVDDVYEDFNINVGDISIINDMTLPENQSVTEDELAAVVAELYRSKGTEAITGMLANALNYSPTLNAIKSTSDNPYRDNISDVSGKTFTIKGLMEDLEIKVSLGTARNPNFDGIAISPFDDTQWTMLEITFNYETEIGNNVKLEATITVIVSDTGEFLDIYGTVITSPKTYHMERFVIKKDTYSIEFEYFIYDEYGKQIYYELKHKEINIKKDAYEKLCEKYDEEYAYLHSEEFYAENDSPEYTYRSYADGILDLNLVGSADPRGVIPRYYRVVVQKIPKVYKVTEILNIDYYEEQETTAEYRYNQLFTCPDAGYYKIVEANGVKHDHYFAGYDVDGDGIADYLPGEKFLITKDMKLSCLWKCAWETPCDKD